MQVSEATTRSLLNFASSRGYASFMLDEPCSVRVDGRNLLCIPSELTPQLPPSMLQMIASGQLIKVNASSVMQLLPCCRPGGRCCPDGPVALDQAWNAQNHGVSCCTKKMVEQALRRDAAAIATQTAGWQTLVDQQVAKAWGALSDAEDEGAEGDAASRGVRRGKDGHGAWSLG